MNYLKEGGYKLGIVFLLFTAHDAGGNELFRQPFWRLALYFVVFIAAIYLIDKYGKEKYGSSLHSSN